MNTTQQQDLDRSQLFLVRLWAEQGREESGDSARPSAEIEWHGRVQHIVSGEAHSFHDWPALVDLLLTMLPPALSVPPGGEHPDGPEDEGVIPMGR